MGFGNASLQAAKRLFPLHSVPCELLLSLLLLVLLLLLLVVLFLLLLFLLLLFLLLLLLLLLPRDVLNWVPPTGTTPGKTGQWCFLIAVSVMHRRRISRTAASRGANSVAADSTELLVNLFLPSVICTSSDKCSPSAAGAASAAAAGASVGGFDAGDAWVDIVTLEGCRLIAGGRGASATAAALRGERGTNDRRR